MSDEARIDVITIVAISSINVNPFEYLDIIKRRRISAFYYYKMFKSDVLSIMVQDINSNLNLQARYRLQEQQYLFHQLQ